jgi:hypothetical protein
MLVCIDGKRTSEHGGNNMSLMRPKLPQTAITYNQYLSQIGAPRPEPYPNYYRKRIDQKLDESKFKEFLMKTMIPMEEHNRRERNMSKEERLRKWDELRDMAHSIDNEPKSGGIRLRKDILRNYERRKRWGDIKSDG